MIEVIYEKEKEETAKSGWVPKNIRQIGNPEGEQKIYRLSPHRSETI